MKRWAKRIIWSVVGVAVLAVAGAGAFVGYGLWEGSKAQPDFAGEAKLTGLGAPVEIVRDARAVPHIYATSERDAWFALGYTHASDRLWQMDLLRRVAEGRLAEAFGAPAVKFDIAMRTLGFRQRAETAFKALKPETQDLLKAYARGVNAYVETSGKPLPPEFQVAALSFEPWRPEASMALTKLLALGLSMDGFSELRHIALSEYLTPRQLDQFEPPYPEGAPVTLNEEKWDVGEAERPEQAGRSRWANADLPTELGESIAFLDSLIQAQGASNMWAVEGALTQSGKPLLASDPHLGLLAPSVWYLAHLSMPSRNLVGASIPGIPTVLMGRNDHIAWGFTTTRADVQDIYRERLNPKDPNTYLTPDGFKPFKTREEEIHVRFGETRKIEVRETRHGVVLPNLLPATERAAEKGEVLALAWPSLENTDKTVSAGIALTRATSWEELNAAMRDYVGPVQNLLFADIEGDIGFLTVGKIPVRRADHETYGLGPARGWKEANDWIGTIPFGLMPRGINPSSGKFVNANNMVVPETYPFLISNDWDVPYRAERIEELLQGDDFTAEDFRAAQMDNRSLFALKMLPHLIRLSPQSEDGKQAVALLRRWSGDMAAGAPEPLIFSEWMRAFAEKLYADELGEAFSPRIRPLFFEEVLYNRNGAGAWCDDVTTDAEETCEDVLLSSLDQALQAGKKSYGGDMSQWRWGSAHPVFNRHVPGSFVPVLSDYVSIERPSSGGNFTVDRGQFDLSSDRPFANIHAGGFRAVYDFADLDASLFMSVTGQSGNPFSPYWDNLTDGWVAGAPFPILTDRAEVETTGLGTFRLMPE